MSQTRPGHALPLGDTIAKLTDMLDEVGGTVDRDRRRAAARLSELVRSDDDDLARFAERHLPGRDVDAATLTDARELAVGLASLVAMVGEAPGAAAALRELRESVSRRLESLDRGADDDAPAEPSSAPPPTMPVAPVAAPLPTFMQSAPAPPSPTFTAPAPAAVVPPVALVPQATSASAPAPTFEILDEQTEVVDPTTVHRSAPLPFASPAAPAPGGADPSAKPEAPATGLPFTRAPQRRG